MANKNSVGAVHDAIFGALGAGPLSDPNFTVSASAAPLFFGGSSVTLNPEFGNSGPDTFTNVQIELQGFSPLQVLSANPQPLGTLGSLLAGIAAVDVIPPVGAFGPANVTWVLTGEKGGQVYQSEVSETLNWVPVVD